MKRKSIVALGLSLVLIVGSFAGCGQASETPSDNTPIDNTPVAVVEQEVVATSAQIDIVNMALQASLDGTGDGVLAASYIVQDGAGLYIFVISDNWYYCDTATQKEVFGLVCDIAQLSQDEFLDGSSNYAVIMGDINGSPVAIKIVGGQQTLM